jgi:hypothetical protein
MEPEKDPDTFVLFISIALFLLYYKIGFGQDLKAGKKRKEEEIS